MIDRPNPKKNSRPQPKTEKLSRPQPKEVVAKEKTNGKRAPNAGMFQPGHKLSVGNKGPQARAARRFLSVQLRNALQEIDPKTKRKKFELVVEAFVAAGMTGDLTAIRDMFNRLEGTPVQSVQLSGVVAQLNETIDEGAAAVDAMRIYARALNNLDDEEDELNAGDGGDGG